MASVTQEDFLARARRQCQRYEDCEASATETARLLTYRRELRHNIKLIQSYGKCNYTRAHKLCAVVTKHHSHKNLYKEVRRLLVKQSIAVCEIIVEGLRKNDLAEWEKYFSSLQKLSAVTKPLETSYIQRNVLKSVNEIGLNTLSDTIASDGYLRFHLRNFIILAYNSKPSESLGPLYEIAMTLVDNIERPIAVESTFTIIDKIGYGSFGTVWKVKDDNSRTSAVKVIKHRSLGELHESRELDVSLTTSHTSIVKCTDAWIEKRTDLSNLLEDSPRSSTEPSDEDSESDCSNGMFFIEVIVMEFCPSNLRQLLDKMNKERKKITILSRVTIFRDILHGLQYLHSKRIIHRDIKPENILIKGNACKICDFGLVAFHDKNKPSDSTQDHTPGTGTSPYIAPEVKLGPSYGPEADIYSLGVILLELTTPFCTVMELNETIKSRNSLDKGDINYEWKYLSSLLMDIKPHNRPTYVYFIKDLNLCQNIVTCEDQCILIVKKLNISLFLPSGKLISIDILYHEINGHWVRII